MLSTKEEKPMLKSLLISIAVVSLAACVPIEQNARMPVMLPFSATIDATKEDSEVGCKVRAIIQNTGDHTPKPHLNFVLLDNGNNVISNGIVLFDVIQVGQSQKKTIADIDDNCANITYLLIRQGVTAVLGTPIDGVHGKVMVLRQVE
jgi:hypothetical protein